MFESLRRATLRAPAFTVIGTIATLLKGRAEIRRLARVSGTIGISTVASIAGQVVKTKVLSVTVGPSGLGLISQAFQLQNTLTNIGGAPLGGMQNALNRRANAARNEFFLVADLGMRLLLWLFGAMALFLALGASPIAAFVFSASAHRGWVYAVGLSLLSYAFGSLSEGILIASGHIKLFTQCRVTTFVLIPAATVVGVFASGIGGAIWGGSLGYAIGVALTMARCFTAVGIPRFRRQSLLWDTAQWRSERRILGELALVSAATSITGFVSTVIPLVLRSRILMLHGADQLGLYQATFSMGTALNPFVFNAVWAHFYPKISVEKERAKLSHATEECIKFCVLGLLPLHILLLLGARVLIPLGYSTRFMSILPWLAWQMSAETVGQAFSVIAMLLLGMNSLGLYAAIVTGQSLLFLSAGLWACNVYGPPGVIYAQLVAGVIGVTVGVWVIDRLLGLKVDKSVLILTPGVIFCVLGIGWLVNR